MKNKWVLQLFVGLFLVFGFTSVSAQTKTIITDIFTVEYSEDYEQPLRLEYKVQCPLGTQGRNGISWYSPRGIHTSDIEDYKNNVWDRGHLAPSAAFNCDKETIKKTYTYLNCALQHEGLNRGPWRELEGFERDLSKFFEVNVVVEVLFEGEIQRVEGGAAIPSGFRKTLYFDGKVYQFNFPNEDVAGQDWIMFKTL